VEEETKIVEFLRKFEKKLVLLGGLVLLMVGLLIPLLSRDAYAATPGLLASRSIEMSSSVAGATGVQYTISFKTATGGFPIEGIVIDFCDNSPLINTACTFAGGTQSISLTSVTWTGGSITGPSDTNTANWTMTKVSPLLVLYDSNGADTSNVSAATQVTIVLAGFVNPNYTACTGGTPPNCTFYARILTYSTAAGATSYAPQTIGAVQPPLIDDGGIALSTNQAITVTSKVQEQLTFCVFTSGSCAGGGGAVLLGDTQGVLYTTGPFVDKTTTYTIATNAVNGLAIRMLGPTLTSGSNTIAAIGAVATASSTGNSQFGLCSWESTETTMVLNITSPYNGANCSTVTQSAGTITTGGLGSGALFAFDTTQTTTTYGATLATASVGSSAGSATGIIAFLGNTSVTQPAGLYTTTLTFVATATY
jgi:hypothetical protein